MMNAGAFWVYAFMMAVWLCTAKSSGLLDDSWEKGGPFFCFWIPIIMITALCGVIEFYPPHG